MVVAVTKRIRFMMNTFIWILNLKTLVTWLVLDSPSRKAGWGSHFDDLICHGPNYWCSQYHGKMKRVGYKYPLSALVFWRFSLLAYRKRYYHLWIKMNVIVTDKLKISKDHETRKRINWYLLDHKILNLFFLIHKYSST